MTETLPARAAEIDQLYQRDCARLERDSPWLATFELEFDNRRVTYRLSAKRVPDPAERDESIIGFAHPLAAAYYEHRPGDEFELERPGFATIQANILERAVATAIGRRLSAVEIAWPDESGKCVRTEHGFVLDGARPGGPTRSVEGLPDIRALLTPEQYKLITSDRARPIIIQGRAGSGKTTVALYRIAYLTSPEASGDQPPIDPSRVLIVMFNRALMSFVQRSLADVELGAATIDTFHGWALDRIKRAYRGELEILAAPIEDKREQERVTAIKKQLGILAAIDEFVADQERRMLAWLEAALEPYKATAWIDAYLDSSAPIVRKLMTLRSQALAQRDLASGKEAQRLTEIHKVLRSAVEKMTQYKDELLRFFTDTNLLAKHLPNVPPWDLALLADYQKQLQKKDASERRAGKYVHFDDLAPLIKLIVRKHGGLPDRLRDDEVDVYDHLMIDEAQDFGALELEVLLSIVRSRTGVTVVGDVNQKIVPSAEFIGWDALARELGLDGAGVARLEVGHRSTLPIMALANSLTGDRDSSGRPGVVPQLHRFETHDQAYACLVEQVARLAEQHERGHVAVVTRHRTAVAELTEQLAADLDSRCILVRAGHNSKFEFEPGVTVTNMGQIKGLEFDAVIALEPSEVNYPSHGLAHGDDGRRWLYTVLTRAKTELVLIASQDPTRLLEPAIERGLLEVHDATLVPTFNPDDDDPF